MSLKTTNEPVWVTHGVAAVLGWVATFLVARGVVTGSQASTLVQTIAPSAVSAALVGLALLVRKFVAPAWKVVTAEAAKVGITLTGESEATALLARLGLDPEGNPFPVLPVAPPVAPLVTGTLAPAQATPNIQEARNPNATV